MYLQAGTGTFFRAISNNIRTVPIQQFQQHPVLYKEVKKKMRRHTSTPSLIYRLFCGKKVIFADNSQCNIASYIYLNTSVSFVRDKGNSRSRSINTRNWISDEPVSVVNRDFFVQYHSRDHFSALTQSFPGMIMMTKEYFIKVLPTKD